MADNEVLDALLVVFNSANYRFLTLREITEQLQRRGIYQNVELHKAMARVNDHLCFDRTSAHYPFQEIGDSGWGLEHWIPKPKRRARGSVPAIEPLHVGWETQHKISPDRAEIERGTFPFSKLNANRLVASMDERQREYSVVVLQCYGSERFLCALASDERDNHGLESKALQHWYGENGLEAGDIVWLTVERIAPLILRIYTEWDRDADAYRRYKQRRNLDTFPSVNLPIRDLIWRYFQRTKIIAHRSQIVKVILNDRPEISERSVDACLSANQHIFVRTGEQGYWGLKEWGIEQVAIVERRKGEDPVSAADTDRQRRTVNLDYVLANLAAEDLVYEILHNAGTPLSYSTIVERIAGYFSMDADILKRTSFLNVEDSRIVHLEDGTFRLRRDLENVIRDLTEKEKEFRGSLERATEESGGLRDELASLVVEHEAEISRIEHERDEARRIARELFRRYVGLRRAVSKFFAMLVPSVGLTKIQGVFTRLRNKA